MAAAEDTGTNWLRAIRGFDRNAYLLFFTGGVLGMRLGSRRLMIIGGILALAGWAIAPTAAFLLYPSTCAFALNGAAVSLMAFLGSVCGGFLPSVFVRRWGGRG